MRSDAYKIGAFEEEYRLSLVDSNMGEGVGSYFDLQSGRSGIGMIIIGDAQEYAWFIFTTAGAISLLMNSSNVVTTSTNNKLVIRDAGTNVRIVNELGSTLTAAIKITYN